MSDEKQLLDELKLEYSRSCQAHSEVSKGKLTFPWDDRENLFFGRYKHPDEPTKSILSTGELTTLNIDRACRVMAQLPSGRFYNLSGKPGANMAMNLLWEHYFLPNMNRGGGMLTKLRMADMYSGVFGSVPAFLDWIANDKYTGPEFSIVHPRKAKPQAGKNSTAEMDVYFVETEISREFLESKKESKVWKNVNELLEKIGKEYQGAGSKDEERSPDERGKTKTGIPIVHAFKENGDWLIWDTINELVLVNEKAYWSGIPISTKHQYPKLDAYWAYSDFERGELTQKSIDTITRLHLDGYDNYVNPPKVYDPKQVIAKSLSTKDWYVKGGKVDAIRTEQLAPQGLNAYQSTYQILKANLLSLGATTDTAVSAQTDPGFGKTPEALKQQGARQGARDAWDTTQMQEFIQDAFTKCANMIAKMGVDPYAFKLIGISIDKIKEQYPNEDFAILGKGIEDGEVSINPEALEGEYRYIMDEGSTLMKNDDTGDKLLNMLSLVVKNPQIASDLALRGERIDFGEAFKRMVIDSGIQDSEKIIVKSQTPEGLTGVGQEGATVDPMAKTSEIPQDPMEQMPELDPEEQEMLNQIEQRNGQNNY
jgi:hypothetical protein